MELSEQIKKKRIEENLSAEDLAIKLGLGLKKDNIYKWEKGSKPSDPEQYQVLMNWLRSESVPHETENGTIKSLVEANLIHAKNYEKLIAMLEKDRAEKIKEEEKGLRIQSGIKPAKKEKV